MEKLKSIDSLVFMLQTEENRKNKDYKMIKVLQDKIQKRIIENNTILYGIN